MAEFDLEKIKIGNDVYKIAAGGNGVNTHYIGISEVFYQVEADVLTVPNATWDAIKKGDIVIFYPASMFSSVPNQDWIYRALNADKFKTQTHGTKNRKFSIFDGHNIMVGTSSWDPKIVTHPVNFISTNCVTYCIVNESTESSVSLQIIATSSLLKSRTVYSYLADDSSTDLTADDLAMIAGTWPYCTYEKLKTTDTTPMPIKADGSRATVNFRYRFTTKNYYYYLFRLNDDDMGHVVGFTLSTLSPTSSCNYAFCLGGVSGTSGGCVPISLKYTTDNQMLPVYLYTGSFDGNLLYLAVPRE